MGSKKQPLAAATVNLEHALAGHMGHEGVRPWAARVTAALAAVERAIGRQETFAEVGDHAVVDVGSGQEPSPGLDRRIDRLHDELADLLERVRDMRSRLERMPEGWRGVEELRESGSALLDALGAYQQQETSLILETATTDIGAGD